MAQPEKNERSATESDSPRDGRIAILFVCMGNICRSPAAEGVLQAMLRRENLADAVLVDSAGTADSQIGKRADPRMREVASGRGYELSSRARRVHRTDLETFDLVVAMDQENLNYVRSLHSQPSASIHLMSEFLDERWPVEVPDPYYGGREGFELVLDMIESACQPIMHWVRDRLQQRASSLPPHHS